MVLCHDEGDIPGVLGMEVEKGAQYYDDDYEKYFGIHRFYLPAAPVFFENAQCE